MPTVPSITVANNTDGTATVTIAGGDAGVTNQIYTLKVDSVWPGNAWVARTPTRAGNGTVDITTGKGAYFFAAVADGEVWSAPVYAVISTTTEAIMTQVLDAVVTRLRLMDLEGVASSKIDLDPVLTLKNIWEVRETRVLVGPMEQPIPQIADSGSTKNRFGYPVLIACVAAANRNTGDLDAWFMWTERIRNAFVDTSLVIPNGVIEDAEYIPLPDYLKEWWRKNLITMFVGLRFRSNELRGI